MKAKSLFKVAGIILAALFAVSMFASATASAAAHWLVCKKESGSATKYTTNQCTTASSTGEWQWSELTGTEAVKLKGSLRLVDTKTALGVSEVECYGESTGIVGPGKLDKTEVVTVKPTNCRAIKTCEKVEGIEARHLPWNTELAETEGKILDRLLSGTGGEPGWKVTCKAILTGVEDECLQVAGHVEGIELANKATGTELLVLGTFEKLHKAHCTQSKEETGEVIGSLAILTVGGAALAVTK